MASARNALEVARLVGQLEAVMQAEIDRLTKLITDHNGLCERRCAKPVCLAGGQAKCSGCPCHYLIDIEGGKPGEGG